MKSPGGCGTAQFGQSCLQFGTRHGWNGPGSSEWERKMPQTLSNHHEKELRVWEKAKTGLENRDNERNTFPWHSSLPGWEGNRDKCTRQDWLLCSERFQSCAWHTLCSSPWISIPPAPAHPILPHFYCKNSVAFPRMKRADPEMEPLEAHGLCLCGMLVTLTGELQEIKNKMRLPRTIPQLGNEDPKHLQGVCFLHSIPDFGCCGQFCSFKYSFISIYKPLNLFFYTLRWCKFLVFVGLSLVFHLFVLLCYAQTCP